MDSNKEIDLEILRSGINRILDYMIQDLGKKKLKIDTDLYWGISPDDRYDLSKDPAELDVGNLMDDWEFISNIPSLEGVPIVYQLTEIAPIIRYIGEKFDQFEKDTSKINEQD